MTSFGRRVAFYFLLILPILAWAAIVLPNWFFDAGVDFSAMIVKTAVAISPVVGGDISIFGEVTPIIIAGAIITLMPSSKEINYFAIALAILSYLLLIHLSVFFSSGAGAGLIAANFDLPEPAQKTILALVSNVRVMAIVVAASILGFKVKG